MLNRRARYAVPAAVLAAVLAAAGCSAQPADTAPPLAAKWVPELKSAVDDVDSACATVPNAQCGTAMKDLVDTKLGNLREDIAAASRPQKYADVSDLLTKIDSEYHDTFLKDGCAAYVTIARTDQLSCPSDIVDIKQGIGTIMQDLQTDQ